MQVHHILRELLSLLDFEHYRTVHSELQNCETRVGLYGIAQFIMCFDAGYIIELLAVTLW